MVRWPAPIIISSTRTLHTSSCYTLVCRNLNHFPRARSFLFTRFIFGVVSHPTPCDSTTTPTPKSTPGPTFPTYPRERRGSPSSRITRPTDLPTDARNDYDIPNIIIHTLTPFMHIIYRAIRRASCSSSPRSVLHFITSGYAIYSNFDRFGELYIIYVGMKYVGKIR